ncbi:MAG: hypothetical protein DLM71_03985 [Chloroflexi bacterium]|nr:MAG: hypothetical protein DLM71_03985 [Chloroflexota bacterium]
MSETLAAGGTGDTRGTGGVIQLWGAVQGPFQPQWDDSWRERVPVALAYLLLGAGTLGGLAVAWRVSRSVR